MIRRVAIRLIITTSIAERTNETVDGKQFYGTLKIGLVLLYCTFKVLGALLHRKPHSPRHIITNGIHFGVREQLISLGRGFTILRNDTRTGAELTILLFVRPFLFMQSVYG